MGKRLVKGLNGVVTAISVFFIVAMLAVVCANVFMRYVLKAPITGAAELTQMLMICMTSCMAPALMRGQHVWIDLMTARLGRFGSMVLDLVTILASSAVFGLLANALFQQMLKSRSMNRRYSMLKIPEWPFLLIFGLATSILAAAMLIYLIDRMLVYAKGRTPSNEFSVYHVEKGKPEDVADKSEKGGGAP